MENETIYNEMYAKIYQILIDNNVDVFNYMLCALPNNNNINNLILDVIKENIYDSVIVQDFVAINRQKMLKIYNKFNSDTEKANSLVEYQIYKIIKTYLYDFNRTFFKVTDGQIKYTQYSEKFLLPSLGDKADLESNANFLKQNFSKMHTKDNDQLCLIILPDGTCYQTPDEHLTLAYWLNVNGVNLKNAIRFESTHSLYDFSFTSLHNYKFSKDSDEDELIEITHEQAEVLGTLYGSLLHCWKFMKPLAGEIKNSSGFGFGKTEKFEEGSISSKNLNRLALYMKDYFDKNEYIRELRQKNNIHNPLK